MVRREKLLAAGADGCRIGWVVALGYGTGNAITRVDLTIEPSAYSLLERVSGHQGQPVLAVDIPIGLPEFTGPRDCDRLARQILGNRRMCVFNPPDRELLGCESYAQVQAVVTRRRRSQSGARGLSKQSFNIAPKIKEFDDLICGLDSYPSWLIEVHPEVSFSILAGEVLTSKKKPPGRSARRALLERAFPEVEITSSIDALEYPTKEVAEDDQLDACVALWSAIRFAEGRAEILGGQVDSHGIPMRIAA
jgi:predicted RNase H-like nuclease